ncbi:MAG: choice-of-anchor tandem repeat NxxGxxAF-containing protein [Planctomycetota bacterium]
MSVLTIVVASAGAQITPIALEGQVAPDGNGTYFFFAHPSINDEGEVAFEALLANTAEASIDETAIVAAGGQGGPRVVARTGDPAPGGGFLSAFFEAAFPEINNSGSVAFAMLDVGVRGTLVGPDTRYLADASGGDLVRLFANGDPVPGPATGTIGDLLFAGRLDDAGRVANTFFGDGTAFSLGVVVGDETGATLAVSGEDPRLPTLSILGFSLASSDSGLIAFSGSISDFENFVFESGILLLDGGQLSLRAFEGDAVTGLAQPFNGSVDRSSFPDDGLGINDSGDIAFVASIGEPFSPFEQVNAAVVLDAAGGGLSAVARAGDTAPGGEAFDSFQSVEIGNDGRIAFSALLEGGIPGNLSFDVDGIYVRAPGGPVETVIELGDEVLGQQVIRIEADFDLNNVGQVACFVRLADGRDAILRIDTAGPSGCTPADLDVPFGVISQADVAVFVNLFFAGDDRAADLAEPFGVVSQADVAEFVRLFFEGCPAR